MTEGHFELIRDNVRQNISKKRMFARTSKKISLSCLVAALKTVKKREPVTLSAGFPLLPALQKKFTTDVAVSGPLSKLSCVLSQSFSSCSVRSTVPRVFS